MAFSLAHTLFFLLLLLPTESAVAQTNAKLITVNSSLSTTDNSSWLSPSGDFAFGFRQFNSTDLFLLSIWYDKIPDRTIVWYADYGDNLAPRGSKVELTADQGLALTGPQGEDLWTSQTLTGTVAAYGVINDTGNFVLEDSSFNKVWESFQNPTDTMLPTQIMGRGGVLSSRQSETKFSKGKFQLRFVQEGNLVLNTINLPTDFPNEPYYQQNSEVSSPGKQLVFNDSGYFYILKENDERIAITQGGLSTGNYYLRVTLNFDGIFTLYSHPKNSTGNQSWTPIWSVPDNICDYISMTGVCGYNNVCKLNPQDKRPTCKCPTGYSLLDPNDPYGSCRPDFIQAGCKEDEVSSQQALYYLENLTNINWPMSDYTRLKPFTEEQCRNSCLQDCMCAVAVFGRDGSCWKKQLPLANGRFSENEDGQVFIKVRKSSPSFSNPGNEPLRKKKNQDGLILAGSVLLGCSVFVIFILVGAICHGFFYKKKVSKLDRNGSMILQIFFFF
ncbi:MAG: hypothetical protein O7C60_05065 [Rickettsia endosymbiont of Ixodes persulcatus]|nr:hypothetical protein [Rickettsia endosymbiont of Ixodes persulcatus]